MKTLIIYSSKHGTTKKVADMIATELDDAHVWHVSDAASADLGEFDQFVIGTPIYAGIPDKSIKTFVAQNEALLTSKPLGLFVCGMMPAGKQRDEEMEAAFPASLRSHAKAYHFLGGAIHFADMNFAEKAIIKMVMKTSEDQDTIDEKAISAFVRSFQQ